MSWRYDEYYQARIHKPYACPLRKPQGPLKGCEETCRAFEACVELTRNERDIEEWQIKEVERQRALFG